MADVVFDDEDNLRRTMSKASPKKKEGFTVVGFLIERRLAENKQQAYLWVVFILIALYAGSTYLFAKGGALEQVGIPTPDKPIPQMSPDRFEKEYVPAHEQVRQVPE